MKRLFYYICVALWSMTLVAHAQVADVAIEMIPTNPESGQTVTLNAQSYSSDINQSVLTWTYNGKTIASGTGKTSVTVVAPPSGSSGTVSVSVNTPGLDTGTASVTLRPGSLDLLWEAVDAYTPPFYKGKALLPVGGAVRLTAISGPNTPKSLTYNWSKNGSALQSASGYNKTSIALRHSPLDTQTRISLSAASGTYSAASNTTIAVTDPQAIAYKSTNGYVDYSRGYADTIPFSEPGAVIRVEPYYFSLANNTLADLSFESTIDGVSFLGNTPNEFALTRPEKGGQSKLQIMITTVLYSLQNLTKTFTLAF